MKNTIVNRLTNHGFKMFSDQTKSDQAAYICSYQLRVRDEEGSTKYFINVALYDYSVFGMHVPNKLLEDYQPEWSVQFNTHSDDNTFNVNLFVEDDIESALKFYDKMFIAMECDYYD